MMSQIHTPKVYIIVLNYCGWNHTIECLESLMRLKYANYEIMLVDNDSPDDSIEKLHLWADGQLDVRQESGNPLRALSFPPVPKPVQLIEYNQAAASLGGWPLEPGGSGKHIILIHSGSNLGFAGGNNIGLKYALKRGDGEYFWLINNDAVAEPAALGELVCRMEEKPGAGLCGSTLYYYHNPGLIQARGGASYNKWLALSRHLGVYEPAEKPCDVEDVERKLSYICGASMLVSRAFLETVGLMSEDYFLFFEEIDWVTRAGNRFALAYAHKSIVYHKEGGSIGSSFIGLQRSRRAGFYTQRNRIRFTAKYFPWALPLVYLSFLIVIFNRIRRRQWDRITMILKIIFCPGCEYDERR
jgi:GT2 family glycosyltransferase